MLNTKTMNNGVTRADVTPLLPRLQLPHDYTVLAASTDPDCDSRTFVLVHLQKGPAGEYAVYRVDTLDGSCHGGSYCGADYVLALRRYTERLLAALGEYVMQQTLHDRQRQQAA